LYAGPLRRESTADLAGTAEADEISVDLRSLASCIEQTGPLSPAVRIAGADAVWRTAEARLIGDRLVARSPEVATPVALRYAWADRPPAPLRDCDQDVALPPFRTDAWPLTRPARPAAR
jgi:sialate O-acetylesterase